MIEAGVISLRVRNDKFSRSLIARIYANAGLRQSLRVHEGNKLKEKVWLRFKQVGCFAADSSFKLFRVYSRYTIPRLCFSPMHWKAESENVANLIDHVL